MTNTARFRLRSPRPALDSELRTTRQPLRSSRRSTILAVLASILVVGLMLAHAATAQVVFSAKLNTQGGPVTRLFRASNGTVAGAPTGYFPNMMSAAGIIFRSDLE